MNESAAALKPGPESTGFPTEDFRDVLEANSEFAASFSPLALDGVAAKGLAIVTCMDSRIDPLQMLGMQKGDVKILRNAGARVTEDVVRTLCLATYLLGVHRILIVPHTECKMASAEEDEIHRQIWESHGVDTRSMEIRTAKDQLDALQRDITRLRAFPLFPKDVVVAGAIYNVTTGRLQPVEA